MKKDKYYLTINYSDDKNSRIYTICEIIESIYGTTNVVAKKASLYEVIDEFLYYYSIHYCRSITIADIKYNIIDKSKRKHKFTLLIAVRGSYQYKVLLLWNGDNFYAVKVEHYQDSIWTNIFTYYSDNIELLINRLNRIVRYIDKHGEYIKGADV